MIHSWKSCLNAIWMNATSNRSVGELCWPFECVASLGSVSPVSDLWAVVAVAHVIHVVSLLIIVREAIAHWILAGRHDRCWSARWRWMHREGRCTGRFLCSIHIGLFLRFTNVFLVANALVSEPVANLRNLNEWKKNKRKN